MKRDQHVSSILTGVWFAILILRGTALGPVTTMADPRGEIRVVENWRPDINVLGHNVLQTVLCTDRRGGVADKISL